ncbi:MAG: TonB-dependent receptor plug [Ignavibacteria bacterium]|nr:TonB-dependent receptor plug [Ignavibacteria bacterium]
MKTKILYLALILIISSGSLLAETKQITGKVTSDKGNPLAGVTVMVKGYTIGSYTKSDGTFKIGVPTGGKKLAFKLIGMKTKELELTFQDNYTITMEEDKVMMDEVVVTAIGLERDKKSLGYAVEDLKGASLSESRTTNLINAISGKVAGVQVTSSAGTPGASSFIRIRGASSITGSQEPLFIVNGVPIDNTMDYSGNPSDGANNLLFGVAYSNRAIDINPDDIENVSILKGPAATALYGIRASSGAIVITTKKGSITGTDKINVSFTSSISMDQVNKLPEVQTKYAQGTGGNWNGPLTRRNSSWGPKIDSMFWSGVSNQFDKNGDLVTPSSTLTTKRPAQAYDNVNNFFQTGYTYTNSLNMTGGSEFGTYYLSMSNTKIDGVVPKSSFERSTVTMTGDAKISSNLKASGSIMYSNSGGRRIQQGSNTSGLMLGLLRTPPSFDNTNGYGDDAVNTPAAYKDLLTGNQRTFRGMSGDGIVRYDNPYWTINENPFYDDVNRLIGHFKLNYYITDWFDVMYSLGADLYTDKRNQHLAVGSNTSLTGQLYNHDITNNDINSELMLNFNYKLSDDLNSKLVIGNNIFQSKYYSLYSQGDGLTIPGFYNVSNVQGKIVNQVDQLLRRMAFYGNLILDYREWLYFDATIRNEQSTTLPEKNNSFFFGSGNLSFIFTEAFKDVFKSSFLSFGQLRANYASVGKDAQVYGTMTQYIFSTYADGWVSGNVFPFLGRTGYNWGDVLGNPELKPEHTTSLEFGVNLNFFENLFSIDFTYYDQKGVDQIIETPIANSSGYWHTLLNVGEITTKGMEVILNINPPIKFDDFKWEFSLNFSTYTNEVVKLAEGVDNIFLGGFSGTSVRAVAGKPFGTIFGYGWLRDNNGNVVIDDRETINNQPNGRFGFPILNSEEKDWGSVNPDWQMGIRNTFKYMGFTLSCLFDIKQGGKLWNGTRGALIYFGTAKETESRGTKKVFTGVLGHLDANDNIVSSGTPNAKEVTITQDWLQNGPANGFVGNNTEDFVEDAGWVRLRELSLSYSLPESIVKYTPLSEINLTFTGRNLWLSTDYKGVDPETNLMGATSSQGLDYFNMPGTKTYNFSINVKF